MVSKTEVPIPETILKRKKKGVKISQEQLKEQKKINKINKKKRHQIFKRAEKYQREYKNEEDSKRNQKIQAMELGNFYVDPEPKLALVIRIRGLKSVSPKPKKALQLLRLRQIHNAVLVRINQATINILRIAEPYITWGYPSLETLRKLMYARGHLKIKGERKKIVSNKMIEDVLGDKDIICIEDLIHELWTVGKNFKKANNTLWPFKLNSPTGGHRSIKKHFVTGGSCGNREKLINDLIERML